MSRTITSANSTFLLTIPGIYNQPVAIQGYSADDAFSSENVTPTESVMGVDGHLSAGFVSHPVKMKIRLQADSPSRVIFDQWYAAHQLSRDAYFANALITLPSIGSSYVALNGVLSAFTLMPPAKKTLKELDYEITFESITTAQV